MYTSKIDIKAGASAPYRPHLVLELPEGDDLFGSAHRAVIQDSRLLSAAAVHVSVHGVVAHVQLPPHEPESGTKASCLKLTLTHGCDG